MKVYVLAVCVVVFAVLAGKDLHGASACFGAACALFGISLSQRYSELNQP